MIIQGKISRMGTVNKDCELNVTIEGDSAAIRGFIKAVENSTDYIIE